MSLASNDHDDDRMTVEQLAAAVKQLDLHKQPTSKLDDIIDIIEYMREQALALHEENLRASQDLHARTIALTKREAELSIKSRAVTSIINAAPAPRTKNRQILARILGR